jgi:hypothetical protein
MKVALTIGDKKRHLPENIASVATTLLRGGPSLLSWLGYSLCLVGFGVLLIASLKAYAWKSEMQKIVVSTPTQLSLPASNQTRTGCENAVEGNSGIPQ